MKHGKLVTSILVLSLAAVTAAFASMAEARSLEQIKASGELLVGSTGDYKPMSYLNKETGKYEGFDAEMAQSLAKYLGVKLKYVPTTWKTLQADTMADKFDVAMSGITVTDARKKVMTMSDGYLTFGKTILVTKNKAGQFKELNDVNQPSVRVMYNPGGTNEKFAKEMQIPVALIEMGFMTNKTEDKQMQKKQTQKKMVDGIANGIDQYFK